MSTLIFLVPLLISVICNCDVGPQLLTPDPRPPTPVPQLPRQPLVLLDRDHVPDPRRQLGRQCPLPRPDLQHDVGRLRAECIDDPPEDRRVKQEVLTEATTHSGPQGDDSAVVPGLRLEGARECQDRLDDLVA